MTWTSSGKVALPQSRHDFAGGTFEDAASYEWQVRTWDAQGVEGPWSSSDFFTAATPPPGPTITEPVNGSTVGSQSVTLRWSYPSQEAYQAQLLDGATIVTDFGVIESGTTRSAMFGGIPNGVTRTARVRVRDGGLWSGWAEVTFDVAYTPPPTPTIAVDDTTLAGAIRVQGTVAAPTGSEPTVTHLEVWRREGSDTGAGIRRAANLAPSQVFTDWFVASGVDYAYRVRAFGDNDTATWSEWSGEPTPIYDELDGGSPDETGDEFLDGGGI